MAENFSYAAEFIADSSGKFCGNALLFPTRAEAEEYAKDKAYAWTLVRQWRVIWKVEPANYHYVDGKLVNIEKPPVGSRLVTGQCPVCYGINKHEINCQHGVVHREGS